MAKIVSSIDIGTNTVTLLIAKIDNSKIISVFEAEEITSLGEGIHQNGLIKETSINRCIKYLTKYKKYIKKFNVEKEICIATSALREAKNSHSVLKKINSINIFPKIISGIQEARLVGDIIKYEFANNLNNSLVIDIGGGSTEFILFKNSQIIDVESINLGSVTLFEKFFSDPITNDAIIQSMSFVINLLNNSFIKNHSINHLIGVGGTITSLSAMYNKIIPYNSKLVHKSLLPATSFDFFSNILLKSSFQKRSQHPLLDSKRARVIPAGYIILKEIMNYKNFNNVLVCERGLRWGALL